MTTIEKSIYIDAPVERVFEFMTNPENLPAIWPSMVEVSGVERQPSGAHSFDWVYKMAGLRFHGHADASEVEKNKTVVVRNEKGIPSTFRYRYEAKNGGTQVTMRTEYDIPGKALSKLAEPILTKLNEREADTYLQNAKETLEHSAAKAAE